jgi:hypothetical protein
LGRGVQAESAWFRDSRNDDSVTEPYPKGGTGAHAARAADLQLHYKSDISGHLRRIAEGDAHRLPELVLILIVEPYVGDNPGSIGVVRNAHRSCKTALSSHAVAQRETGTSAEHEDAAWVRNSRKYHIAGIR